MRKLFLFSLLSTLFICTSEGKKVEGKIIFNADSVIKVTFNIPFNSMEDDIYYEGLQHVAYYFDANGKEVKLIPGSAKEIQFTYGYEKIRMLSIYYKNRFMFLKLLIDGNLKLYNYYSSRTNPGIRDPITGFSWG
ncbi:MAG: hypothetical protein ACWA6U_17835, partial [Breznakibacter sp.]